jgi:ABC-type multidrug transport system fused ATPase/permease subunit
LGPLGEHELGISTSLLIVSGLTIAMLAFHLLISSIAGRISADALSTARLRVSKAFLASSWDIQSAEQGGRLQDVLTTHAERIQATSIQVTTSLRAACSLAALIITALVVDALVAVALVASVVGIALFLRPVNRQIRLRSLANRDRNSAFATRVAEVVGLAQEIKVFDVAGPVASRVDEAIHAASWTTRRLIYLRSVVAGLYQAIAMLLVIGGLAAIHWSSTAAVTSLGAIVLLLIRSMSYGQQLQTAMNALNEAVPYLRTIQSQERAYQHAAPITGQTRLSGIHDLELRNVSYSYGEVPALKSVSLGISSGDVIGVVGPSGSGKSTLIQVLLRLRWPTNGLYLVNGQPAQEFALNDWFRLLAMVPQQPRLFEGTVADNIRFFRDELTEHEIQSAAERAHIHNEIVGWPDGYNTNLSGITGGVSGGQAQRLCIARALAGGPQLLVLDEPTSALDVHSEARIQQTLAELEGKMTLVVIAHRLTTLRMCHKIIVLRDGRLEAFDQPVSLERDNRYYREAVELSRSS